MTQLTQAMTLNVYNTYSTGYNKKIAPINVVSTKLAVVEDNPNEPLDEVQTYEYQRVQFPGDTSMWNKTVTFIEKLLTAFLDEPKELEFRVLKRSEYATYYRVEVKTWYGWKRTHSDKWAQIDSENEIARYAKSLKTTRTHKDEVKRVYYPNPRYVTYE